MGAPKPQALNPPFAPFAEFGGFGSLGVWEFGSLGVWDGAKGHGF